MVQRISMADQAPEHGVCPFMSAAYPAAGPGGLTGPGGQQMAGAMVAQAPCIGSHCQLWDHQAECCAVKGIGGLARIAINLAEQLNQ